MDEPTIQFPVVCPVCHKEALLTRSVAKVASVLLAGNETLELCTPCHEQRWTASKEELQQIREYLGAWITSVVEQRSQRRE